MLAYLWDFIFWGRREEQRSEIQLLEGLVFVLWLSQGSCAGFWLVQVMIECGLQAEMTSATTKLNYSVKGTICYRGF